MDDAQVFPGLAVVGVSLNEPGQGRGGLSPQCPCVFGPAGLLVEPGQAQHGRGEIRPVGEPLGLAQDELLTHGVRLPEVLGCGVEPPAVEQDQADRVLCGRLIFLGQRGLGGSRHRRTLRRSGRRLPGRLLRVGRGR